MTGEVLDQLSASARPLVDAAVRRADAVFQTITAARRPGGCSCRAASKCLANIPTTPAVKA